MTTSIPGAMDIEWHPELVFSFFIHPFYKAKGVVLFEKNIKAIGWSYSGPDRSRSGNIYYASYRARRSGHHDDGRSCK